MRHSNTLLFVLAAVVLLGVAVLCLGACSHSNNLLLGEVRTKLGSHDVVVTDCYRSQVPPPSQTGERLTWQPCRDADIVIDHEQLAVNGRDYGKLGAGDSVLVDHGVVSVGRKSAAVVNR